MTATYLNDPENPFSTWTEYKWKRRVDPGQPYYEVSTKGDKRFSAFNAHLFEGLSIELAYQLDVKGYRRLGHQHSGAGKGKPPLEPQNLITKIPSHYSFSDPYLTKFVKFLGNVNRLYSIIDPSDPRSQLNHIYDKFKPTLNRELIVGVYISLNVKDITFIEQVLRPLVQAKVKGIVTFIPDLDDPNMEVILANNTTIRQWLLDNTTYLQVPDTGSFVDLWSQYFQLWEIWASRNKDLILELAKKAEGKTITDMFATSDINQARALCEILNKHFYNGYKFKKF